MEGWADARECRLQYETAKLYGIKCLNGDIEDLPSLRECYWSVVKEGAFPDNEKCDCCDKPATVIHRCLNVISMPWGNAGYYSPGDRIQYLCDKYAHLIQADVRKQFISVCEMAHVMQSFSSRTVETMTPKQIFWIEALTENFLFGLKSDKIRLGKFFIHKMIKSERRC